MFLTVFDRYRSYSPYDIEESIRKEVKGDLERSFLTLGNARSQLARAARSLLARAAGSWLARAAS